MRFFVIFLAYAFYLVVLPASFIYAQWDRGEDPYKELSSPSLIKPSSSNLTKPTETATEKTSTVPLDDAIHEESPAELDYNRDEIEKIPAVFMAIQTYKEANSATRNEFLAALESEFEKACDTGDLESAKALQTEMENLKSNEFDSVTARYTPESLVEARNKFESDVRKNQTDFLEHLNTAIAESLKKKDVDTADKIQKYSKNTPYTYSLRTSGASNHGANPWIYLFDGKRESFRKHWCFNARYEIKNNILFANAGQHLFTKESFENYVLEVAVYPTVPTVSIIPASVEHFCIRDIREITEQGGGEAKDPEINLLASGFDRTPVRSNSILSYSQASHPYGALSLSGVQNPAVKKALPVEKRKRIFLRVVCTSKDVRLYDEKDEMILQYPHTTKEAPIGISGGAFSRIRIRPISREDHWD